MFIGVVLVGGLIFVTSFVNSAALGTEVALPVLAISGVLVLLIGLGILAMAFSLFKLSDSGEALGLPPGSVRAVIALALVLLFAILSVFLYGDLSKGGVTTVANLTGDQKDLMVKNIPSVELVNVLGPKDKDPNKGTYQVSYRARNPASEDFAKQVLTMIGTLLTAVASFYFGAKTATSAQAAAVDAMRGGSSSDSSSSDSSRSSDSSSSNAGNASSAGSSSSSDGGSSSEAASSSSSIGGVI